MIDDSQLDVYYADLSPISCEVRVRLRTPQSERWSITGCVRGPESRASRMLPATHALRPMTSAAGASAVATVPDPCFWAPELPAYYRLKIDVSRDAQPIASFERTLGIRPLSVRGKSLYWDSRRWVLRAVSVESALEADLSQWRNCGAAMAVARPSEELCREATEQGVLLVARASGDENELIAEARRISKWGAVGLLIIESWHGLPAHDAIRGEAPNLLVATNDGALPAINVAGELRAPPADRAAIAIRRLVERVDLPTARAACDRLQRDLAPLGDWAGYVV
jgi:hypothetical protein